MPSFGLFCEFKECKREWKVAFACTAILRVLANDEIKDVLCQLEWNRHFQRMIIYRFKKSQSTTFPIHFIRQNTFIQHCERSELRLHFEWTKVNLKCQKLSILASFWKPEACGQTVLSDRSVLKGQKLVKNAKIQKFKWDILGDFQTMCKLPLDGVQLYSYLENSINQMIIKTMLIRFGVQ